MNIRDAESAILAGQAKAKQQIAEFVVGWFEPYTDMGLVMWWRSLTPFDRAALRIKDPEAYAKVKEIVERMEVSDASL